MSIIIKDITKVYGTQTVLDNVNININKGEIVGLLGPNGAGKSTLMKILTCYIPPTKGDVFVDDIDALLEPQKVKSIIGYLPESNPLYTEMYIREYLEFIAGMHKLGKNAKSRIDEIIEITGLTPEIRKKIGMLSKGYRQRVGLAQALIHDPKVLILDEPTSGLDPNQLIEIRKLITDIGKEKTVLLSTHIMQEVSAMCSRVVIINQGKIIADKPTEKIVELINTKNIVVEFSGEIDPKELKKLKSVRDITSIGSNIWKIEPTEEGDLRKDINDFAHKNSLTINSLRQEDSQLENVFHKLTTNN